MLYYYFITLDKLSGDKPEMSEFQLILKEVCNVFSLFEISPYPIHSIEFKQKGSLRRNTKVYDYPHYHCILTSWIKTLAHNLKFQFPLWSVNLKYLYAPRDLAQTVGYIYKNHRPDTRIICTICAHTHH